MARSDAAPPHEKHSRGGVSGPFAFHSVRRSACEQIVIPHLSSRPCRQAIFAFLLAAFPGLAFAQKPAVTPAAPPPALGISLIFNPREALDQKQTLDADSRLDRLISLDVISVPLGEVLQKESLDKSTETMEDGHQFLLTAAPDCADLKLQIRLNNRSLRTLMTALAQMLPKKGTRTPHGYQLAMTKEAAAARAEWWRLFLGEREKALAVQRRAVLTAMQTKAHRRQIGDPDPEQSDRVAEEDTADQHDFFHSLPPTLKEQIASNMDNSSFYDVGNMMFGNTGEQAGTIGWLSRMSPQTQEKFKVAMQNNVNRLAQAPLAYQGYATQAQKALTTLDTSQIYFLFQNGGFTVLATPFNGPPSVSTILVLNVPMTTNTPPLALNHDPLTRLVEKIGASAPNEWKRLAAYQRGRVWPNILPNLIPEDHSTYHPAISRAAQTDWLEEQGHMEYVSDYYSHGGYSMPAEQKKLPVKRPLAAELDEMAVKRDVSWTKDADGIYLVRNNRWYRDDDLEVPEPLLRRWFAVLLQVRRQEAARHQEAAPQTTAQSPEDRMAALRQTWDWAAEVYSTLTPWQMKNGLALFQPEEKDQAAQNDATAAKLYEKLKHYVPQPGEIAPVGYNAFSDATRRPPFYGAVTMLKGFPHTAQLYGSLDDAGRTALLEGPLPASALNTPQRTQAVSLQPFLPQAMQRFPTDSVFLGLLSRGSASNRVVFADTPDASGGFHAARSAGHSVERELPYPQPLPRRNERGKQKPRFPTPLPLAGAGVGAKRRGWGRPAPLSRLLPSPPQHGQRLGRLPCQVLPRPLDADALVVAACLDDPEIVAQELEVRRDGRAAAHGPGDMHMAQQQCGLARLRVALTVVVHMVQVAQDGDCGVVHRARQRDRLGDAVDEVAFRHVKRLDDEGDPVPRRRRAAPPQELPHLSLRLFQRPAVRNAARRAAPEDDDLTAQ